MVQYKGMSVWTRAKSQHMRCLHENDFVILYSGTYSLRDIPGRRTVCATINAPGPIFRASRSGQHRLAKVLPMIAELDLVAMDEVYRSELSTTAASSRSPRSRQSKTAFLSSLGLPQLGVSVEGALQ